MVTQSEMALVTVTESEIAPVLVTLGEMTRGVGYSGSG
jgi:hypothetical protein